MNRILIILLSCMSYSSAFAQKNCIKYYYLIPTSMTPEEATLYQSHIKLINQFLKNEKGKCKGCEIMEITYNLEEYRLDTMNVPNWEKRKCRKFYLGKELMKKNRMNS